MELKQMWTTPDGQQFSTKAEAEDYLRRPKVKEALMGLTHNDENLADFLVENQEFIESVFDIGVVRRVSKAEHKKLANALEHVAEVLADDPKAAFLIENTDAVKTSFKWPSVKKMDDEEKAAAAKTSLEGALDTAENAAWVLENKDAILEAYKAGKPKRDISPKALEGLAAYRARLAAEKAAAEGGEASTEGGETTEEVTETE